MKTAINKPTTTKKFHIDVPTNQYLSPPAVYKVYFGKHYLIWKGKSLLQSCGYLAESIERYIRLKKNDETDYLYHVCNHIKRTRCIKASVEVIQTEFKKEDSESINGFRMLKLEQELLDKAKDDLCLNNNAEAYIPKWVKQAHVERFMKYLKEKKAIKRDARTQTPA